MRIGSIEVKPATVARHAMDLIELADGLRVSLPVLLINGARPGPRLYLGAGIHGDEVGSVAILARVVRDLRPAELSGSLVCVMVQNPLALHADHRIPIGHYLKSPLDQAPIDAWTCFPGNADGPFAEVLAAKLFNLIRTCEYAIDLHTPTRGGRYVPITILPPARLGAAAAKAEELGEAFGSGYVIKTDKGMYVRDGILNVEATKAGVPAFTFELGEGGRVEPDLVALGAGCVLNVLRHLGMLTGSLVRPAQVVRVREFLGIRSTRGGILYNDVELGASLKKGDNIARIVNIYGDEVERITAPSDGINVRTTTLSTVAAGERVATIGLLANA